MSWCLFRAVLKQMPGHGPVCTSALGGPGSVIQHFTYFFLSEQHFILLIIAFDLVMAQEEKTVIKTANKGYMCMENVVALCIVKEVFTTFAR